MVSDLSVSIWRIIIIIQVDHLSHYLGYDLIKLILREFFINFFEYDLKCSRQVAGVVHKSGSIYILC